MWPAFLGGFLGTIAALVLVTLVYLAVGDVDGNA